MDHQTYTEDELLRQPALFRYGPRALWALGVLFAALCLVAVQMNSQSTRSSAYDQAFELLNATTHATRQSLEQLLARTRQTTHAVRLAYRAGVAPGKLLLQVHPGEAFVGDGIWIVLVSSDKEVQATGPLLAPWVWQVRQFVHEATGGLASMPLREGLYPASEFAGRRMLPVVESVGEGTGLYAVYLLDIEPLQAAWLGSLSGRPGWLQLRNASGQAVYEFQEGKSTRIPERLVTQDTKTAMSVPLDWNSPRWLVSRSIAENGLMLQTGISEPTALLEYRQRYRVVVGVVWAVTLLCLAFSGGTAIALRRFSNKEAYLRNLAMRDALTRLPNRRYFNLLLDRAVEQALTANAGLGLFFIDLDNFKYVNDTLGHEAGDRLLKVAARMLEDVVGSKGVVCRLGGDEFTVLAPGVADAKQAQRMGDAIAKAMYASLELDGLEVQPKGSVGAALFPAHAQNASDLMRFADIALYASKCSGKGCATVYDPSMSAEELAQVRLMQELERALASEDELYLEYQPKFQVSDETMSGFEALLRWRHPRRGIVMPSDFITLAEKSGHVRDLGNWVLARAVRQMRQWHEDDHGWQRVAVNVSPLQLREGFVETVRETLAREGVPGQYLQLELTEGTLARNPEKARKLINELRSLDVVVAVDDFGTGYSSLAALQEYELDCLKIDRTFISTLHLPKGHEICRAVVSFAHALGMRVIAEGVETFEQRALLREMGCDEAQG